MQTKKDGFDERGIRQKCKRCGQTYFARFLFGTSDLPPDWEVCPCCQGEKSPYTIEAVKMPLVLAVPIMVAGIFLATTIAWMLLTQPVPSLWYRVIALLPTYVALALAWRIFQVFRFIRRTKNP